MNIAIAVTDVEAFLAGQLVDVQLPKESFSIGSLGHVQVTGDLKIQKVS